MIVAKKDGYKGFLFILPSLIFIIIFSIIPIFMSGYYSLSNFKILSSPSFVGIDNYSRAFKDPYFYASLRNTLIFTAVSVPLQTILALIFANVLATRFKNSFGYCIKSILFIPVIASGVLIGALWFTILSSRGLANSLLGLANISPVMWLGKPNIALLSVCIISVWKNVGYFLVIYYAGIMDIPQSLYEAAYVDGASNIKCFFHITLPSLSKLSYLVVTLGTIWSFQVFDIVYTMTGGGPGRSTVTLVYSIYKTAFKDKQLGYASALAMILLMLVLVVSALQKKLMPGGSSNE